MTASPASPAESPKRRMPRAARTRQLLDTAWALIGDEGTDALTLGRLADAAGVSKPIVYDHFGTRNGLLVALYQDYDARQTALFADAIDKARPTLQEKARVIASSYVSCVVSQGREMSGVIASLNGSPELTAVKREYQHAFMDMCAGILAPFTGPAGVSGASLWAMMGAADALSEAAADGEIADSDACEELLQVILSMVKRSK
ncbi:TetR/AcrR family transcriptional regulator [Pigmentiphaga litoralis]|uniref:AcrR family transcriptional regulator n=1 Tax=Pigmentiphaga litoralis TaxID=516702 RepID=A0A7Y9IWB0_9BURK|nr:TetR/AcrR family transcriptional regulator [Pigmentiphaga litoralis]NYE22119.1 AcrR family transcriptional regulator [Pigmentiphaga litoralis]NYE84266.1 AcrR family transcriptional regulator [Pigmentiphaga litoralis]